MKSYILLIILASLTLLRCDLLTSLQEPSYTYDLAYVESVVAPDTIGLDETLTIKINGYLPDPSWSFHHFDLFEGEAVLSLQEAPSLTIQPIARQDESDSAATVLVAFERELQYTPRNQGMLILEINGRTQTLTDTITVN